MADEAQELAEKCARAMLVEDKASAGLGISLEAIAPGQAELAMTVTENMVNGHNICHGGMIFTLADSAFAFACNTYNQVTVAASAEISFLRPAQLGDRLLAVSREIWRGGRSGIYDTTVTNQSGEKIAEFRGKSRAVKGTLI